MQVIIKQSQDFLLTTGELKWEGHQKGDIGYRIINRVTGVCEGEGSILVSALRYVDLMQESLDDFRSGLVFDGPGPNDVIN